MIPPGSVRPYSPVPFAIQIVGFKNSGKTTLIAALIPHLKRKGFTVGTIKHDAHDFFMDKPGTDTWKHQEAGADATAISSARRSAILRNHPESLTSLLAYMHDTDIVLIEGFKQETYPKLVLIRRPEDANGLRELQEIAAAVIWPEAKCLFPARAGDAAPCGVLEAGGFSADTPVFGIDDIGSISGCVQSLLARWREQRRT